VTAVKTGALVVGIYENRKLSKAAGALDKLGAISAALKSGDISGKPGSTLLLRGVTGIAAERIVLLGLGAEDEIADKSFAAASAGLVRCLATLGCDDAALALPFDGIKGRDLAWAIRNVVLAGRDAIYRSDTLKSKKDPAPPASKRSPCWWPPTRRAAKAALGEAVALANGMADQGTGQPARQRLHPDLPGQYRQETGQGIQAGRGSAGTQAAGSAQDGQLPVGHQRQRPAAQVHRLKHLGGKAKDAPVVLVGKGITFDTGGISLKPGLNMDEMKYDMCGAASCWAPSAPSPNWA
jgi:leucyl aminopeptidase